MPEKGQKRTSSRESDAVSGRNKKPRSRSSGVDSARGPLSGDESHAPPSGQEALYGSHEFWSKRYAVAGLNPFEWLFDYETLEPLLKPHLVCRVAASLRLARSN
jgi:hypothetical protein